MKNDVLIFESKIIIVIALVKIGNDKINNKVVIRIDHKYKFIKLNFILLGFILYIDLIKLIELRIDDNPFKWIENTIKLIDELKIDKGGYNVHPVLILLINNILVIINIIEGIINQNLKLLIRGKFKSIEVIIIGISQFLKLPIIIGIIKKKIIINAWVVIKVLYKLLLLRK